MGGLSNENGTHIHQNSITTVQVSNLMRHRYLKFIGLSLLAGIILGLILAVDGCDFTFSLGKILSDEQCRELSASWLIRLSEVFFGHGKTPYLFGIVMFLLFWLWFKVINFGLIISYFWLRSVNVTKTRLSFLNALLGHLFIYFLCVGLAFVMEWELILKYYKITG